MATTQIKQQVIDKILSGQLSLHESYRLADRHHILEEVCSIFDWDYTEARNALKNLVESNLNTMVPSTLPCRGCKRNRKS